MQFKKAGKCPSAASGTANGLIWLSLKNNTRWPISVDANGVEDQCYGDFSPFYQVEANGSSAPDGPIPDGRWSDVGSSVLIEPGESLEFSVPRSHLDPGLGIRIDFEFSWGKEQSVHSPLLILRLLGPT